MIPKFRIDKEFMWPLETRTKSADTGVSGEIFKCNRFQRDVLLFLYVEFGNEIFTVNDAIGVEYKSLKRPKTILKHLHKLVVEGFVIEESH